MNKILFISAHLPSLKLQAGNKTSFNFIEKLKINNIVDVKVIMRKNVISAYENIQNVQLFKMKFYDYFISFLLSLFLVPFKFLSRISSLLVHNLKGKFFEYNEIILDGTAVFWLVFFIPKRVKVTCLCHDILFHYAQKYPLYLRLFNFRYFFIESLFFNKAKSIIVQSPLDKKMLVERFNLNPDKITLLNPYLSPFLKNISKNRLNIENGSILFWGAMDRKENYLSIQYFVNKVFLRLISDYKFLKLYIVGSNPNRSLLKLAEKYPKNIIVTGFIDDPSIFFEKAHIGIAPLILGAGIKVKVLEMLSVGIPVIVSPIGAEGIEDKNLRVLPSVENFYEEILTFINE